MEVIEGEYQKKTCSIKIGHQHRVPITSFIQAGCQQKSGLWHETKNQRRTKTRELKSVVRSFVVCHCGRAARKGTPSEHPQLHPVPRSLRYLSPSLRVEIYYTQRDDQDNWYERIPDVVDTVIALRSCESRYRNEVFP